MLAAVFIDVSGVIKSQMASTNSEIFVVEEKLAELEVNDVENHENESNIKERVVFEPHLSGFEIRDLYKIALNFYKEKEGKAVHLSYEDKLKLVAFTQQVNHGKCTGDNAPPLGVLDVIGRDRRMAWQNLGDITKEQAMEGFVVLLDKLCPLFKTVVEAKKRDLEEKMRLKKELQLKEMEEAKRQQEIEDIRRREEEERMKQENQRRQIQDALNQQTYRQFKIYAEQQYPGNPEQQGILIRQLQEQHYHQYMQQLYQNQALIDDNQPLKKDSACQTKDNIEDDDEDEEPEPEPDWPPIATPEMWTRKDVEEFKETIRKEAGDAVIKVGHGETVTVRVPTHEDGACLFWEFATDGYDIGFGVYFEWSKPSTNQVSVHISESEEEEEYEQDFEQKDDLESGETNEDKSEFKPSMTPVSVIVPVFRRDSQEEVYAGSHQYPGQGVYLLKFDNSYSLWRSKTLYYRVYYTRPGNNDKKVD